jgi:hypothetical protein
MHSVRAPNDSFNHYLTSQSVCSNAPPTYLQPLTYKASTPQSICKRYFNSRPFKLPMSWRRLGPASIYRYQHSKMYLLTTFASRCVVLSVHLQIKRKRQQVLKMQDVLPYHLRSQVRSSLYLCANQSDDLCLLAAISLPSRGASIPPANSPASGETFLPTTHRTASEAPSAPLHPGM